MNNYMKVLRSLMNSLLLSFVDNYIIFSTYLWYMYMYIVPLYFISYLFERKKETVHLIPFSISYVPTLHLIPFSISYVPTLHLIPFSISYVPTLEIVHLGSGHPTR